MTQRWTIGTDRADGGIVANGEVSGSTPELTRGERTTLTFAFWYDSAVDADPSAHIQRYEDLRAYSEYAGSMTTARGIDGKPYFTERIPASAPVDSLVLDFVPGSDYEAFPTVWGIVRDVTDETRFVQDVARLEVSIVVLGDGADYADRAAVKSDLEGGVL